MRFGGVGLNKAESEGEIVRLYSGGVWGSDGGDKRCSKLGNNRGVHTQCTAAVVAETFVYARQGGDGDRTTGCRRNEPTQAVARGKRLDCSEATCLDDVDAEAIGAVEAVGSGAVEVGSRL